jgi:hypothetical protein
MLLRIQRIGIVTAASRTPVLLNCTCMAYRRTRCRWVHSYTDSGFKADVMAFAASNNWAVSASTQRRVGMQPLPREEMMPFIRKVLPQIMPSL